MATTSASTIVQGATDRFTECPPYFWRVVAALLTKVSSADPFRADILVGSISITFTEGNFLPDFKNRSPVDHAFSIFGERLLK
jgi:hypothetical protein